MRVIILLSGLAVCVASVMGSESPVRAAPTFWGPLPYLSEADIPAGFYSGGSPAILDDFEDGTLDFGITADYGMVYSPAFDTDSVDADGPGGIDGYGTDGHSYFYVGGFVTFTFLSTVTTAAMVWTDGGGACSTTFEAFGPGMISLGTHGPFIHADGAWYGETAEDRFYGVQDPDGIIAIRLTNSSGGMEVDHLQSGDAPTLIELASFEAVSQGPAVLVRWETASEIDSEGFHLWRALEGEESQEGDEEYIRITWSILPSEGGPLWGAHYEHLDEDVGFGRTYLYKLEAVDIYGRSTFHGPVEITAGEPICFIRMAM